MRVKEVRQVQQRTNQQLRRARHLFVLFCRKAVEEEGTVALNRAAERMRSSRLYIATDGPSGLQDIRFRILRIMWRMDGGTSSTLRLGGGLKDWSRWCDDRGWIAYRWVKKAA